MKKICKASVKRRTSHEPNLIAVYSTYIYIFKFACSGQTPNLSGRTKLKTGRNNFGADSGFNEKFAFSSAHVKVGVLPEVDLQPFFTPAPDGKNGSADPNVISRVGERVSE